MIRYAITDGAANALDHSRLRAQLQRWSGGGVLQGDRPPASRLDFVQLREKHLAASDLLALTRDLVQLLKSQTAEAPATRTRLLLNGPAQIAAAAGADGVHLTSAAPAAAGMEARRVYEGAGLGPPIVSISCHNLDDVRRALFAGVDLILFGPVFEKRVHGKLVRAGEGLESLQQACRSAGGIPVLALGGVTADNTAACLAAGAAGIAAIRLFA